MKEVQVDVRDNNIRIMLSGRIDSVNAETVKEEIFSQIADCPEIPVAVDADGLEYISSAGLRVLLRIRKDHPDMSIENVSTEIYDILEMTGFTEMMHVSKAFRQISVDGSEIIDRGANGTIYRIDEDSIVKVYHNSDSLDCIRREREVARLALILGIPTAISYDVVKVGDKYGAVYELLNARSFSRILAEEPDKMDWCIDEYVSLLKKIHSTEVPDGKLPDFKETANDWADFMMDYLPPKTAKKLKKLIEAVPFSNHMIHGDYHTKNVVLAGDEVLLIDMDTLAIGDPVFEFGSIFNAFKGFSELDPHVIEEFQGFSRETGLAFWNKVLEAYSGTDDPAVLQVMEDKARVLGYTRLIRRSIRRKGLEEEKTRAEIEHWKAELIELIDKIDCLSYRC